MGEYQQSNKLFKQEKENILKQIVFIHMKINIYFWHVFRKKSFEDDSESILFSEMSKKNCFKLFILFALLSAKREKHNMSKRIEMETKI